MLREGEWNLNYPAYGVHPGADLVFGSMRSGIYLIEPYEITTDAADVGDVRLPGQDGMRLGQDWRGQSTVTFELGVDSVDAAVDQLGRHGANLGAVSRLAGAWDGEAIRLRAGQPAVLRTVQGGRARRLYGRPRKLAASGSRLTRQGYTPVVATFTAVDTSAYDDVEQSVRVGLQPPPHYGLVGPLTTPLTMVGEGATRVPGEVYIGGDRATWPVMTIYGPITKPAIDVVGRWTVALDLTLRDGERVTIDPRPWAMTVLCNGNANVAGYLTRSSPRMRDMRLPAGVRQDIVLRGTDATGTSYATVAWRDAYSYL
ncbi:hypothetical protein [Streptomyces sp. NPDC093707]|uniref:hypothetical protein n=1 Tax=Streptomyces sp. NPDC093707 TaxID=3154984 RepID=UPI00344DDD87